MCKNMNIQISDPHTIYIYVMLIVMSEGGSPLLSEIY